MENLLTTKLTPKIATQTQINRPAIKALCKKGYLKTFNISLNKINSPTFSKKLLQTRFLNNLEFLQKIKPFF